ncbi:DUF397 domain-containing protein [Thermomonospora sp. CIF 1]|uniref:DUF397 domain-containing protein n=1 Tax=Thermomonospora sp. CIF 1 TaxID=1916083 RepID=UPI000CBB9D30|nr:DUF397 domain-containing protein [Thermomonospora sp. CIF 1]PKK13817.1 MAG: DUF397 domain-containing protein [Thermomonospora sp. CIF 1]
MESVDVRWRKSSYTTSNGGDCVEVARLAEGIGIRDSKNRERGHLTMPFSQFTALLAHLKQRPPIA